ncbi:hypothetical protein L3Q82_008216 [Scortum barcoo]|uniref:Uncharacterized protein n=1 Tax=Scortum barcoo TaxID=214431 RepID=A0ACB8WH97_9TELE|nr:hypothetical protein L3Q82_008216 [Scortum barcoo]
MTQGPNLVLEWLSKLHLAQYVESFIDNGYDDLEVCKQIGEPDLDAIGVHVEYHRHRLLAAVQKLKDEDKRKAPGYYFTLEPLDLSTRNHSDREEDFRTVGSTLGKHKASCPGNHNLRFTDCNDFVTYPKLKLKVLIRDKLAKDGINLGEAPYTHKCPEHGGATRRQASTSGDVEEAVGGQQPSSRTATSAFVQGGTGGALPEPCKMSLQQATNVHVSAQTVRNRLHEGGMRARRPQVGVVLTAQHRAGRLAFAMREHQDWQIRHWLPCALHR